MVPSIFYTAALVPSISAPRHRCASISPGQTREGGASCFTSSDGNFVAIFFPEVVVATAAEQWLSAYQSVRSFAALDLDNHHEWTVRHGFFADMGGIWVTSPDSAPFAVDSHQLASLIAKKYLPMPHTISAQQIGLTALHVPSLSCRWPGSASRVWGVARSTSGSLRWS